VVNRNFKAQN